MLIHTNTIVTSHETSYYQMFTVPNFTIIDKHQPNLAHLVNITINVNIC